MALDLPLSALRNHTKDRILDVDTLLDQVLERGATPDVKPAPRGEDEEGGAQPSERP